MGISEILDKTDHRPWEIPGEDWKFYQEWNQAIFLHWEVNLDSLKEFVPSRLEIDLFMEKPWVSLVAFNMEKIHPRNLPSIGPISNFYEINIRTYVRSENKSGVYFLSIEGANRMSCKIAKAMSALPYRFSSMDRTDVRFESKN